MEQASRPTAGMAEAPGVTHVFLDLTNTEDIIIKLAERSRIILARPSRLRVISEAGHPALVVIAR
jgi:hypothetical protein